jgi:hypothetical protein
MSIIFSCAKAYEKLLDVEYQIILGKKNKQINFSIFFTANHFIHLAGFQHLKDKNTVLSGERDKIFEKILKDENYSNQFETSVFYSQIKERIEYLSFLESIMDSNKTIFKYNPQIQVFSAIQADFLLKNEIESISIREKALLIKGYDSWKNSNVFGIRNRSVNISSMNLVLEKLERYGLTLTNLVAT